MAVPRASKQHENWPATRLRGRGKVQCSRDQHGTYQQTARRLTEHKSWGGGANARCDSGLFIPVKQLKPNSTPSVPTRAGAHLLPKGHPEEVEAKCSWTDPQYKPQHSTDSCEIRSQSTFLIRPHVDASPQGLRWLRIAPTTHLQQPSLESSIRATRTQA